MSCYQEFARVYDLFMDNVPYEEWSGLLIEQLQKAGITDGLIADLGCGTGKITRLLAEAGYDMIGIDSSPEMLNIAREQEHAGNGAGKISAGSEDVSHGPEKNSADTEDGSDSSRILYLCQDMRGFELYGTVRAVVSICDSLNYILDREDLQNVFSLVDNYLDPGGLFLFDFHTDYMYREVLGDTVICENREQGSFIWENFYDEDTQINEYDLTFYIRQEEKEESGEYYCRFEETHYQKGYSLEEMKAIAGEAGLCFVTAFDADTKEEVTPESERIFMVVQEKRKWQNEADSNCRRR